MKRLLLAAAAVGLAGTIGTANAVPINSTTVQFWNGSNGGGNSTDARVQALPSAAASVGGIVVGPSAFANAINYNLPSGGTNTIAGFFAADTPAAGLPAGCASGATCGDRVLSTAPFNTTTLFEFVFTAAFSGPLTVNHDDGVSLFLAGNEGVCNKTSCPNDLFPLSASIPQTTNSNTATLTAGATYDLWYSANNGLPEVLQTNLVPAPLIGHGLLVLLAVGGVLSGGKLFENHKKQAAA
jgi:hypothetical protein